MKRLLKKVPGVASVYHQARCVAEIIYEGWLADRRKLFDRLLAGGTAGPAATVPEDPSVGRLWDFETPFNMERYRRTLIATDLQLRGKPWGDVLELGCGTGVFTTLLAARARTVLAVDISRFGCERTRDRCSGRDNVRVDLLDLRKDAIPGEYDLVFAMDVLEYAHGRAATRSVAGKLTRALRNGGMLVTTVTRLPEEMRYFRWVRWLVEGGDAIADFLDGQHGLQQLQRDLYPRYLIAVYQKTAP